MNDLKRGNCGQAQSHMSSFNSEIKRVIKIHYIAIQVAFTSMQISINILQVLEKMAHMSNFRAPF